MLEDERYGRLTAAGHWPRLEPGQRAGTYRPGPNDGLAALARQVEASLGSWLFAIYKIRPTGP